METQIKTAKEVLAQIERRYFKGAGLAKASTLEGDERRTYVLAQAERLLTTEHGSSPLAMWLSDEFWTADEGRKPMFEDNPLLSLKEQQTLTDKEMARLRMILEIAGLCHDLSLHFLFDLKEAFGIKNIFWVSNKQLVEWLSTTEYERIAMHTAYTLRKHAIDVYVYGHYQPAQDAMAELFYGVVPLRFDKGVLAAAQALYDYMDREVYGRMTGDNPFAPEVMKRFAEKVREVRSEYLAKGWIADNSLEFAYLMAHAQNCGYGIWREEDDAL